MANAGKWALHSEIGSCELRYDNEPLGYALHPKLRPLRFSHKELQDLKYTVERAIQEMRSKLPEKYWYEVE